MPIKRCSHQTEQSLEEFYSNLASSNSQLSASIGKSMLSVIEMINKTFSVTEIYGLTSHAHLLLMATDNSKAEYFVAIIANEDDEFHLEYSVPKFPQRWRNPILKVATKSLNEFNQAIIVAMSKSNGWPESCELKNLYEQIEIQQGIRTEKGIKA